MAYLYGDSSPFPLDENFLETLRDVTEAATGLLRIDCRSSGNARSGTSGEPITIRAENERQAALVSDGSQAPFEMIGCAWWRVEGLRAQDADNSSASQAAGYPFRFREVRYVTGRRLLGSHNNRMQNTHVYAVEYSEQVLLDRIGCHASSPSVGVSGHGNWSLFPRNLPCEDGSCRVYTANGQGQQGQGQTQQGQTQQGQRQQGQGQTQTRQRRRVRQGGSRGRARSRGCPSGPSATGRSSPS